MTTPRGSQDGMHLPERLADLRETRLPDGFSSRLHQALVQAGPPAPPSRWARLRDLLQSARVGWAVAGLAVAIAVVATVLALPHGGAGVTQGALAVFPESKVALVKIDLRANVAVADANIRISLPDGLVFWSDGQALAQRSFEWTQSLAAGANEIPIAVRGEHPGVYHVTVHAELGGEALDHDVPLEVTRG